MKTAILVPLGKRGFKLLLSGENSEFHILNGDGKVIPVYL